MSQEKSPEEEPRGAESRAAAKIQAGFRGYRVRKRLQEERAAGAACTCDAEDRRRRRPSGGGGGVAERARHREPEAAEEETMMHQDRTEGPPRDDALEDKSATKIQAGVRGFLVRKRQQAEQAAATRIQAGFRGFRARKLLNKHQQDVQ